MHIIFKKSGSHEHGFTIIELMLATAVFSVVLLIATVAVIMVSNSYVKGNIQSQTQDAARSIISNVIRSIQFNGASSISTWYDGSQYGYDCFGNLVYDYQINHEIDDLNKFHALLEYNNSSGCPPDDSQPRSYLGSLGNGQGGQELLSKNLRLGQLSVQLLGSSTLTSSVNAGQSVLQVTPLRFPISDGDAIWVNTTSGGGGGEYLLANGSYAVGSTTISLRSGLVASYPKYNTQVTDVSVASKVNTYEVTVTVGYGGVLNDTLNSNGYHSYTCPAESLGGQFCAVSTLTSTVTPRIP